MTGRQVGVIDLPNADHERRQRAANPVPVQREPGNGEAGPFC